MPFDECGFCDRVLDDDETLTPVFIGERPTPRPVTARGVARKQRDVIGRRPSPGDDVEVLGRPVDELAALVSALETSRRFSIETKPAVHEVYSVGEAQPMLVDAPGEHTVNLNDTVDDSKVGVTVEATPETPRESPDLEVCRFCAEAIGGGSDE